MPERPDLRKIATDIKEAIASYPREALVDILTYVFQAYVVEGTPPIAASQPERLAELEGMSFPELIQALQARLDVPELALFEVAQGRVSVKVAGQSVALTVDPRAATAPLPLSPAQPAAPPASPPPAQQQAAAAAQAPRPGVRVEEVASMAPRPVRGLSVNPGGGARPMGSSGGAPAPAAPAPAAPAGQQASSSSTKPEEGDEDAASKRFRLLEID
jgi:hypothetical protein